MTRGITEDIGEDTHGTDIIIHIMQDGTEAGLRSGDTATMDRFMEEEASKTAGTDQGTRPRTTARCLQTERLPAEASEQAAA